MKLNEYKVYQKGPRAGRAKTLTDKVVRFLIEGLHSEEQPSKNRRRKFTTSRPESFYWVGNAGSVRSGKSASNSVSITARVQANMELWERRKNLDNINLVKKMAWDFMSQAPSTIEFSDLVNEAYLAYLEAGKNYDPERSKFTTWAYHYMSGYLKNFLNKERKQTGHAKFYETTSSYSSSSISNVLSGLEEEAKQVCYMILCTPNVYGRLTKAKSKNKIKNLLRQKGYSHRKIENIINELQTHFQKG